VVAGAIVVGWAILLAVYLLGIWPIDVAFFVAVAVLTFGLGLLSALAAITQYRHRNDPKPPQPYRSPQLRFVSDLDNYFRWLTPLGFTTGVIFAHFFWH